MLHVLVILFFAALLGRDQIDFPTPFPAAASPFTAAALTLGPFLALALSTHLGLALASRRLTRRGWAGSLPFADHLLTASRVGTLLWHIVAVYALGWLDAVRAIIGNLVGVDELLAAAPALMVVAGGWWSAYPIDRALRDAVLIRSLDQGLPLHPPLSRRRFVTMHVRHQLLLVLVPIAVLSTWSEWTHGLLTGLIDRAHAPQLRPDSWYDRFAAFVYDLPDPALLHTVAQLAALAVVLSLMPVVMRFVWDTTPLPEGPLRDRLLALCARHAVGVRNILVWRTGGSMANGAVLGLFAPLRYVLLTDTLLERLPDSQLEAVMAHEVGHVRRRHIPWLVAALLAALGASFTLAALAGSALHALASGFAWPHVPGAGVAVETALAVAALAMGIGTFGFVSRRFEWQADAFALQHLSGLSTARRAAPTESATIAPHAADDMADALRSVCALNHIDPHRASFRHGSIRRRLHNLRQLVGRPARTLPIDRIVLALKAVTAVVLAALLALALFTSPT